MANNINFVNPDRYFVNPYSDYDKVHDYKKQIISEEALTKLIKDTAFVCMQKIKLKVNEKYCDGGVYTGSLGLIFMCYKMLSSGRFDEYQHQIKDYMNECLKANEQYYMSNDVRQTREISFILGKGGLYVMGSLVSSALGLRENAGRYASDYADLANVCEPINFLPKGSDELFVGRAGFLCGLLVLKKYLNLQVRYFITNKLGFLYCG
jgi:hypothetical protein